MRDGTGEDQYSDVNSMQITYLGRDGDMIDVTVGFGLVPCTANKVLPIGQKTGSSLGKIDGLGGKARIKRHN